MAIDAKIGIYLGVILSLVLAIFFSVGHCETYYVREDGTAVDKESTNGCNNASSAMSVTTHNGETFSAGDIIKLCSEGGDFTTNISPPSSGTSVSKITYENGAGVFPIIDASDDATGFNCNLKDYLIIKNIWIENALTYGILVSGTNVIVQNVVVLDSAGKGIFVNNSSCIIYNSVIYGSAGIGIDADYSCTIINTIVRSSTGADIDVAVDKTVTGTSNILEDSAKAGSGTYADTNTQWSTNPLFIGEATNNFRLQSASSGINEGKGLGDDYDCAWNPRDYINNIPSTTVIQSDYGAKWDIGIFGYTGANAVSGIVVDWNQEIVTGKEIYIFILDITGADASSQLTNSSPIGSCVSNTSGAWSIPTGFGDAKEYLIVYQYYGTYKGYQYLAGAEFKTLGGN